MKVTVSVHGRYHGFELADGLHRRGLLDRLLTTYPAFAARRFVDPGVPLVTAPWLEARRRIYDALAIGRKPDTMIARAFARFAKRSLRPNVDILVGWSSATLEAMPAAKELGMKVVIERGSTHIAHQTATLAEEYGFFGVPFDATEPEMIEREEAEYAAADAICVPSDFAAGTFIRHGIHKDRLIVNPLGVDVDRFTAPAERPAGRIPRILFVGAVGLRKGVPRLLQAFSRIKERAELRIIGPVEPGMGQLLSRLPLQGVVLRGPVQGGALPAEYEAADIFCLPSIEEGFGMVIPQAMASGLPIVTTKVCGAADLVRNGETGLVIPPSDESALLEALGSLLADPERRYRMGKAGQAHVNTGCDWGRYVERAVRAYEALVR